jgi:hypothetical protein
MSPETIANAVPAAIRRASKELAGAGPGWTIRILTPGGPRELRLASQRQVARLASELERLGFVLDADAGSETDFVFSLETADAR